MILKIKRAAVGVGIAVALATPTPARPNQPDVLPPDAMYDDVVNVEVATAPSGYLYLKTEMDADTPDQLLYLPECRGNALLYGP